MLIEEDLFFCPTENEYNLWVSKRSEVTGSEVRHQRYVASESKRVYLLP